MPDETFHNTDGQPRKRSRGTGLDGLTDKQRAYVTARVSGMERPEAYKAAYDTSSTDRESLRGQATVIERSTAVKAALERVKQEMEAGKGWDIKRLRSWVHSQLILEATTCPAPAARVKALELLGKDAGMFQGKTEAAPMTSVADLRSRLHAKLRELQGEHEPSKGTSNDDAAQHDGAVVAESGPTETGETDGDGGGGTGTPP